jgi:hypothetical protein
MQWGSGRGGAGQGVGVGGARTPADYGQKGLKPKCGRKTH